MLQAIALRRWSTLKACITEFLQQLQLRQGNMFRSISSIHHEEVRCSVNRQNMIVALIFSLELGWTREKLHGRNKP